MSMRQAVRETDESILFISGRTFDIAAVDYTFYGKDSYTGRTQLQLNPATDVIYIFHQHEKYQFSTELSEDELFQIRLLCDEEIIQYYIVINKLLKAIEQTYTFVLLL